MPRPPCLMRPKSESRGSASDSDSSWTEEDRKSCPIIHEINQQLVKLFLASDQHNIIIQPLTRRNRLKVHVLADALDLGHQTIGADGESRQMCIFKRPELKRHEASLSTDELPGLHHDQATASHEQPFSPTGTARVNGKKRIHSYTVKTTGRRKPKPGPIQLFGELDSSYASSNHDQDFQYNSILPSSDTSQNRMFDSGPPSSRNQTADSSSEVVATVEQVNPASVRCEVPDHLSGPTQMQLPIMTDNSMVPVFHHINTGTGSDPISGWMQQDGRPRIMANLGKKRLPTIPNGYVCNFCSAPFDRQTNLNRHAANHIPRNAQRHPCQYPGCSRTFRYPKDVKRHMNENCTFRWSGPSSDFDILLSSSATESLPVDSLPPSTEVGSDGFPPGEQWNEDGDIMNSPASHINSGLEITNTDELLWCVGENPSIQHLRSNWIMEQALEFIVGYKLGRHPQDLSFLKLSESDAETEFD